MFKRMRNRVRLAALTGWDLNLDRRDLALTEEDILRDLVGFPRLGSPATDEKTEVLA